MKRFLKSVITLFLAIWFLSCDLVTFFAEDIYIVYNEPKGFTSQAKSMAKSYSGDYTIKYVRSSKEYVEAWNDVANGDKEYDNMIIMLHGGVEDGVGGLYFYQESLWNSYSELDYLGSKLQGNILLLSCNGGTGLKKSVAYNLSKKSGASVVAASNSSVNYDWLFKNPYLDDKTNGQWVRITAIRGTTYRAHKLGTSWKFDYLDE